jgi:hypothetical protein
MIESIAVIYVLAANVIIIFYEQDDIVFLSFAAEGGVAAATTPKWKIYKNLLQLLRLQMRDLADEPIELA